MIISTFKRPLKIRETKTTRISQQTKRAKDSEGKVARRLKREDSGMQRPLKKEDSKTKKTANSEAMLEGRSLTKYTDR